MCDSPPRKSSCSKPRGRPRVETPASSAVTTWLPARDHDRLAQLAKREEKTISALVRELLKLKIG
jgi:hypothetical protein